MADQRATLDHQLSTTGLAFLCTKPIVQQADDGSVDEHQRLLAFDMPGLQRLKTPIFPQSGSMPLRLFRRAAVACLLVNSLFKSSVYRKY
jgi:hypothetical protein